MTPKIHFISEYDQIVNDYGPPLRQWCIRYEARHAYFKKITIKSNNFKNVPKMLATRYSLKQIYKLSRLPHLRMSNYAVRIQNIEVSAFKKQMKELLLNHFGDINLNKDIVQCSKLCYDNIEYCRFTVLIIGLLNINEQPIFGQIIRILKTNEKWWLLVDVLTTVGYDENLFAWEIKSTDHYVMLDPHNLKSIPKVSKNSFENVVNLLSYQKIFISISLIEYDIDGTTLEMMSNVERISTVIPTFKQQLLFLKEREKLFQTNNGILINSSGSSSSSSTNLNSSSSSIESISNNLFSKSLDQLTSDQSFDEQMIKQTFPDKYIIPPLPDAVLKDIEEAALHKFGPHCSNRQILVDAVAHDLISNYKIFYPNHQQFDVIGIAIVEFLKLPATKHNVGVWKDALQTKLKRKRSENSDHIEVQQYQLKYARVGSGRPIKKRIGEVVQRDRQKQMMLAFYDETTLHKMQLKAEQLRDISPIDINNQVKLWNETMQVRRQYIRENSTSDIVKEFPGYSNPILIFEEIKMIMKVDLAAAVRRQVPILIEKISKTFDFINDSSPFRLIKILCREFNETVHHILSNTEPSVPHPTLVLVDDRIYIYVDFVQVVSTSSPDDALALLIAMYTIFELAFNKNSRSIRLLYSILYADPRFLPNTIRIFLKEKNIDVYDEENKKLTSSSTTLSNYTTTSINSQSSNDLAIIQTYSSPVRDNDINSPDPTDTIFSQKNADLDSNILINTDQASQIAEESSTVLKNSQNQYLNSRKRPQRVAKAAVEKSKLFIDNMDDNEEDTQENHLPNKKRKSSTSSRSYKRTRRD
ncbi:unnamed protein product [Adineta steineri]|uniref:Uncharacterized protein n=1 Tax=Adineta steineri TaxID=433720 RepID=A0A815PDX8_9BILA|nr:unnamed protein product [Adineta steineri]